MADWKDVFSRLENKIAAKDYDEILKLLNQLIVSSLELQVRQSFQHQHIQVLKVFASRCITDTLKESSLLSPQSPLQSSITDVVTAVIKLLRNICAQVSDNQRIISEEGFIHLIGDLITVLCRNNHKESRTTEQLLLLKVSIQLLGNCSVNNKTVQPIIWRLCYSELFSLLLSDIDSDVVNYTCMIIHVCIENTSEQKIELFQCFIEEMNSSKCSHKQSISNILRSWKSAHGSCEWIAFVLEALLKEHRIELLYNGMPDNRLRIALLNFVFGFENETSTPRFVTNEPVLWDHLAFLVTTFSDSVAKFLTKWSKFNGTDASTDSECLCSEMLVHVLKIICKCSSQMELLKLLQEKQALMESALDLLAALSEFDGSSSSACNITNLSSQINTAIPSFLHGVKRDLVQVIGNLCLKCRKNQDFMSDHVLLLLNQCGIDHSNPYITQWAVWTIRNICEDHLVNQDIISQLEKRGLNNMEELQKKFGCEVEIDKFGKLNIKKN